jgi:hypothetical protein
VRSLLPILAPLLAGLLTGLLTVTSCSRPKPSGPVDMTLTRALDVTGDGEEETITLHITGAAPTAPFKWTLVIDADGKTIYHTERDDAENDALFSDADAMAEALEGCAGYAACKERYYTSEILGGLLPTDLDVAAILDRSSPHGLYGVGRAFLKQCCARTAPATDKILKSIADGLRDATAVVITIPASPVAAGPLLVFSPDTGLFVPIYRE